MSNEESYWNEKWIPLEIEGFKTKSKYELSNHGRVKSYAYNKKDGRILKNSEIQGYKVIVLRDKEGRSKTAYLHKLVAEHFLKDQKGDDAYMVIHKDYSKKNNHIDNLRWVNRDEFEEHLSEHPNPPKRKGRKHGYKLNPTKVRLIKRILARNKKTRLKMIAKQFGITHTQLNRIRSGENWGDVTIDDEEE